MSFSKSETALAEAARAISAFWKTHSCKLIPNWTRNRMITYTNCTPLSSNCKWFEPRSISSSYCVIVRVSVVLKRTIVSDWRFDNLSGSHLQSQMNNVCQFFRQGAFDLPTARPPTLVRLAETLNPIKTGGRGGDFSNLPSGKIVITFAPKELWHSNFLTFPKIYLETFWYIYHVHAINHVAMATSFWQIGLENVKNGEFFVLRSCFYT